MNYRQPHGNNNKKKTTGMRMKVENADAPKNPPRGRRDPVRACRALSLQVSILIDFFYFYFFYSINFFFSMKCSVDLYQVYTNSAVLSLYTIRALNPP